MTITCATVPNNPVVVVAIGNISFTSKPAGATIYIDNVLQTGTTPLLGGTPLTISQIAIGSSHTIRLELSGYQNYAASGIVVTDGGTTPINATFAGSLNISSTPVTGASVYIDGNGTQSGVTPLIITGFTPGIHTYKLTKTDYLDTAVTNFTITAGETTTVSQAMVLSTGSVLFTSTPAGARIWLGPHLGTLADQSVNTQNTISSLTPGSYDYKLVLSGYTDLTGTITITAAQQTNETVTFAGSVYIASTPTGAEIFLGPSAETLVDQILTTPQTFKSTTAASSGATTTWYYKLTKAGYANKTGSFLAIAGQTINVPTVTWTAANISATSMLITYSDSPCIEGTCTVHVDVTWTNTGESPDEFVPNIIVGDVPLSPAQHASQSLGAGETTPYPIRIDITSKPAGVYYICPYPN